jgi:2-phospho-L-lactate guanylyltransferase (CobY/MobA/RfbA family)
LPEHLRVVELGFRQACLNSAVRAGIDAGCAVILASPEPLEVAGVTHWMAQAGSSFGERLSRALDGAFAATNGSVVLVGTDVPDLDPECIRQAVAASLRDPEGVVLGPSPDGGFYLLAAARPLDGVLGSVRWCGHDTLRTLIEALTRAGRAVSLLAPLADLDRPRDLEKWLAARSSDAVRLLLHQWVRCLSQVLAALRAPGNRAGFCSRPSPAGSLRLGRAPPAFARA